MTEVKCFPTAEIQESYFENLFNDPRHVLMQGGNAYTYHLYADEQLWGSIHFVIHEQAAYSPFHSLFGGFEMREDLSSEILAGFYKAIEKDLVKKNIEQIVITLPAGFYRKSRVKLMKKALEACGFSRLVKFKNHAISISEKRLWALIHPMEKRKLKKCNESGLAFYREPVDMLPVIYEFIRLCRKEKMLPVSIDFDLLQQSFDLFPDHYFLFTVKKNNEIYAATIAVKVNNKVLYNFLPASPTRFNDLSPTVKLIDGLYDFARRHHYEYLDLGVSTTAEGKDQKTLIEFKQHMGGKKSSKVKLGKMLKIYHSRPGNPKWTTCL